MDQRMWGSLHQVERVLGQPLVIGKPVPDTPIRLYFEITDRAISSVILQDQDKVQKPVYFVSKVLQVPKTQWGWGHFRGTKQVVDRASPEVCIQGE